MYLPSMLLGGSSILHLLAGHPRVVAFFGVAAAAALILYTPFASQPVPGTARYVQTLESRLRADAAVDPAVIEQAQASARAQRQAPTERLREIVADTLRACGDGCRGLDSTMVMRDATMLEDALLVHELSRVAGIARHGAAASSEGSH